MGPKLVSERAIDTARPLKVIYIGAGISGIIGAIQFRKMVPSVDLVIYEKNPELGGTWYENRYPGCACDIPSHAYQLTYESWTDWSSFYSTAPNILEYWQKVANKHNIRKHIKFNHKCCEARWDESRNTWKVTLQQTGHEGPPLIEDEADVLITGTGLLNEWKWPSIKGLADFKGDLLHTAKWDTSFDPIGKNVAVVGAGSSGIQLVPAIVSKVKSMDHYIRGRTWISNQLSEDLVKERAPDDGSANFEYTLEEKEAWKNDPEAYIQYRKSLEFRLQGNYGVSRRDNPRHSVARVQYEQNMRQRLASRPDLADALIPNFPPLCRRLTPGPGYLEALTEPRVNVIFDAISFVDADSITTTHGVRRPIDAIICATGFETSPRFGFPIFGRDGVNLREKNAIRPKSYLSLCTDNFPNFFQSLGPNSFQGAGSLLLMMEQTHIYMGKILQRMAYGNVKTIVPKRKQVENFTNYCDEYFQKTVYTTDCVSWYKAAPPGSSVKEQQEARVTALWPGSSVHAMKALESVRWEDYEMETYDGNDFGWFGNGLTEGDQNVDPDHIEQLTWYLNDTRFLHENTGTCANGGRDDGEFRGNEMNDGKGYDLDFATNGIRGNLDAITVETA
ncbi:hypothetical protein EDB81DRAFT_843287 [Dactylonectria macrodidyma]|uniref:Uncharacterized protein n=1 Tax=Dactylonectria macrodidyma TaxID=307937 RepID=A0A9P9J3C1_9HYPO|nr:hypothetical protein EDB81DRAFT_843287 [Dactylonectria macrodidyma]